MKIGFIGAGKVGVSLGKYFAGHGSTIVGYVSRSQDSEIEAAAITGSQVFNDKEALVKECDMIFLTVPDAIIKKVWDEIKDLPIKGKIICHCSGALSSSVFSRIAELGAYGCSIHPLMSISDKSNSYSELYKAMFTIEGDQGAIIRIKDFLTKLGNKTHIIEAHNKIKYHAAAVMVSNQVIALIQTGIELLKECGFTQQSAEAALMPLVIANIESTHRQGPVGALTGPIERNDIRTVLDHIENLHGRTKRIYIELSEVLVELAREKHPNDDFGGLEKELAKK